MERTVRRFPWFWALFSALMAGAPALCPATSAAAEGFTMTFGTGSTRNVEVVRAGLQVDWKRPLLSRGPWHLGGYWEFELAYWRSAKGLSGNESLMEGGVTPVFRMQRDPYGVFKLQPYVEGGVGVHWLSEEEIEDVDLSTLFQFGSEFGLGLRWGRAEQMEFGYRFQHLSNASIKQPNPGMDFHLLHFGYRF